MHEHDEDDYRGPAILVADDREIPVEVVLRGHFQPIDGRFHWYGRLSASDSVRQAAEGKRKTVVLRTEVGEASGTLSDPDPWGRYRITGTGKPPFAVPQELPEE